MNSLQEPSMPSQHVRVHRRKLQVEFFLFHNDLVTLRVPLSSSPRIPVLRSFDDILANLNQNSVKWLVSSCEQRVCMFLLDAHARKLPGLAVNMLGNFDAISIVNPRFQFSVLDQNLVISHHDISLEIKQSPAELASFGDTCASNDQLSIFDNRFGFSCLLRHQAFSDLQRLPFGIRGTSSSLGSSVSIIFIPVDTICLDFRNVFHFGLDESFGRIQLFLNILSYSVALDCVSSEWQVHSVFHNRLVVVIRDCLQDDQAVLKVGLTFDFDCEQNTRELDFNIHILDHVYSDATKSAQFLVEAFLKCVSRRFKVQFKHNFMGGIQSFDHFFDLLKIVRSSFQNILSLFRFQSSYDAGRADTSFQPITIFCKDHESVLISFHAIAPSTPTLFELGIAESAHINLSSPHISETQLVWRGVDINSETFLPRTLRSYEVQNYLSDIWSQLTLKEIRNVLHETKLNGQRMLDSLSKLDIDLMLGDEHSTLQSTTAFQHSRPRISFGSNSIFQEKMELRELLSSVQQYFQQSILPLPIQKSAICSFFNLLLLPWPFVCDVLTAVYHQVHGFDLAADSTGRSLVPFRLCLESTFSYNIEEGALYVIVEFGDDRESRTRLMLCHENGRTGRTRSLYVCLQNGLRGRCVVQNKSFAASLLEIRAMKLDEISVLAANL
jgi:hypothetical protein